MSWRNSALLALLCACVSACGFTPLHGRQARSEAINLTEGVAVDSLPGRDGHQYRINLEDKLNPSGAIQSPRYRLIADLNITEAAIGVSSDGTVSRYNVYFTSNYQLLHIVTGKPVTKGRVTHVGSYNNLTNAYYSTYISREDTIRDGLVEMSEIVKQRLSPFLIAPPGDNEGAKEARL